MAACTTGVEIIWFRSLLGELGYTIDGPSPLHIDNNSAVSVSKNPEHHGRMKHLDLRFFWLREAVNDGHISLKHISTNEMPADILTKSLARQKVSEMRVLLGVL